MKLRLKIIPLIALVFSVISVLLIMFIVLGLQPRVGSGPFTVINRTDYQVDYYELSVGEPVLVVRGVYDGSPVPITVSLFAFTPGKVYVVGYYYGDGAVSINLTGSLIMHIANRWLSRYGDALWPSLIAFITYTSGNKSWTVITAVPYDPSWVITRKPISMVVTAELDKVKPAILKLITSRINNDTINNASSVKSTVITGNGGESYFGYLYVGNCLGNSEVNKPTNAVKTYWVPVRCDGLKGLIPLMFIGWSRDVIRNSIISIAMDFTGTAYRGFGLYGIANVSSSLPTPYSIYSIGPTIIFNSDYNLIVENASFINGHVNNEGAISTIVVGYSPILNSTSFLITGVLTYVTPNQGFVYLGPYGNISYISFEQYYLGQPLDQWVNVIVPLSISPDEILGNTLFIYPGLDTGNGPITGMFTTILHYYHVTGQLLISLLDGYSYPVNRQCSNAPPVAQTGPNQISYTLTIMTIAYPPNSIAYTLAQPPTTISSTSTIISILTPTNLYYSNQVAFYSTVVINYYVSPTKSFYVTFLGIQQTPTTQWVYPMGMIINETNYYLGLYRCQG